MQNLFLDGTNTIKLGDFGLSALVEDGPVVGVRGSISYAAPEVLRLPNKHLVNSPYSTKQVAHSRLKSDSSISIYLSNFNVVDL